MALTIALLGSVTFDTNAGNKTVTATPTAGDLIVVVAATSGLAGGTTAVSDNNPSGGGYVQVDSDRTGFSTTGVLTVWVRTQPVGYATSTIFTASQAGSTGGGLGVLRVAGMKRAGANAVRSNGGQSSAATGTPAPVLNQAALTTNGIISAVCNGTNSTTTATQRSSPAYSEDFDNGYNTPATGMEINHLNSGETATTLTYGGSTTGTFASFAIELDASDPLVIIDPIGLNQDDPDIRLQSINRGAVF